MNGHNEHHVLGYVANKKELNELYVSTVLRVLAFSMVGIFVPLFLFNELGYSLNSIIQYYLVYAFSFIVFSIFGAKLVSSFGVKHSILISMPLYVAYFGLLYLLKLNPWLFFIVPMIYGASEGIFWMGFHLDFALFSAKAKRGKQIGKFYTFALLAGLVGPMVGGGVLTFSSFNLLFFIVSLLILGSAIPLFLSKDVKRNYDFSLSFLEAGSFRDFLSFVAVGGKLIVEILFWPIFVFSILKLYVAMGSLFTILGILGLIVANIVGRLTDVFNKRKLIRWFAGSSAIIWVVKIFVRTKLELIGAATFSTISNIGVNVPYSALTYNKAKKSMDYFIFREIGLNVGKMLVLVLVMLSGSLMSSFLYAALASLGYMLL